MKCSRHSILALLALVLAAGQLGAQAALQEARPIPPIATLMKEVMANQDRVDRMRENYSCTDLRTVRKLDKHGRVKNTKTYLYQVSFFGRHEVNRLIAKDGRPLSPHDQKKEDKRIAKDMEKYQKEQAERAAGDSPKQGRNTLTIQDFLRAARFIHPRRENRAGEDLIVFDFERNPDYKPRSRMEKVVQALAGTIWIDEKAHEVVELDAHLEKNVKIAGGLVGSLHKGSAVSFVQTFVDRQVWLPTFVSVQLSARALLFFGLNIDQTDRYSAYQKFHVKVRSTVAAPHEH